jgi:quercetin dioxygenase-like cupin family protein
MQYGLKHLTVLAEDQKVRVLRYAPHKGDKTPIHSHPSAVVYVLKGGRVKYTQSADRSIEVTAVGNRVDM